MIEVLAVKLDKKLNEAEQQYLLSLADPDIRLKVMKYRMQEDFTRSLIGHLLIKKAICDRTRLKWTELKFEKTLLGKPFLSWNNSIHFNISHSGQWVVCSIGGEENGIDIEEIKPIALDIAKRFFTAEEQNYILNSGSGDKHRYFYQIWTMKESYLKFTGKGLNTPLNSFSVCPNHNLSVCFEDYPLDPCYMLSVCAVEGPFASQVKVLSLSDFLRQMTVVSELC